jgi:hypothetical protein
MTVGGGIGVAGISGRSVAARVLAAAVLIAGTAAAHARIETSPRADDGELWVPRPELARLASIGFQNVVSDYYWLQALQVVGGSTTDPSHLGPLLGRLVDVVTTLDPWVDHPYRFAALWMTDSEESVRKADALLARGIERHPDDWRNHFYQGFNRFFYLQDNRAAVESLERAVALPGSPRYLPRLVARLHAGLDGLDTSAAMLAELVANAQDPYTKAEYEKALDEVETERRALVLDAARAEFNRRRGRDIGSVEELVQGPGAVLRALPPELHGWEWTIDPKTGRIVSSWYRARYEPTFHPSVAAERAQRKAASAASATETR